MNYYKILDIPDFSDIEQVKKAYRKQSVQHHPDNFINESTEIQNYHIGIQQQLNEAYNVLSNSDKKKKYDFDLNQRFNEKKETYDSYQSDYNDMYESIFRDMDIFNSYRNKNYEKENELRNRKVNLENALSNRKSDIYIDDNFLAELKKIQQKLNDLSRLHYDIHEELVSTNNKIGNKKAEINSLINRKIYQLMPSRFKSVKGVLETKLANLEQEKKEIENKLKRVNDEYNELKREKELYFDKKIDSDPEIIRLRKEIYSIDRELKNLEKSKKR